MVRWVVMVALCVWVALSARNIAVQAVSRDLGSGVWLAPSNQASLIQLNSFFRSLIEELAPDGDIFVEFRGEEYQGQLGVLIYYLWSYHVYPRRVLVSEEGAVINDAASLARNLIHPDEEWLIRNRIDRVITLDTDQEGNLRALARDVRRARQ